jgi:hypothetical protein
LLATVSYLVRRKHQTNGARIKRLDITDIDGTPDFDPYILPPRVDPFRPPVGPSLKDRLLKGVDDLFTRPLQMHESHGEMREASIASTQPDTLPNAPEEPGEPRNVVYHQDGGEYHVPPSYSEINFPRQRNS